MPLAFRVIARLDVKGTNLIKGYQMEGLRVLGNPAEFARRYAEDGADEILYLDTVASLYGRQNMLRIVEETAEQVFIPITVGGGIRSLSDIRQFLRAGADKVAINTAAMRTPDLIREAADTVGSQAVVVSIEAKRTGVNGSASWEAFTDQGRCRTGMDALRWAEEAVDLGAGEVLLTSIDRDGTRRGADVALGALSVGVPVVLAGGIGSPEDAYEASKSCDALAIGAALHYGKTTVQAVKQALAAKGREIRLPIRLPASQPRKQAPGGV